MVDNYVHEFYYEEPKTSLIKHILTKEGPRSGCGNLGMFFAYFISAPTELSEDF